MLWELPGPRSFLRQIESDIARGGVCVIACPSAEAPQGLTEALEQACIDLRVDPFVREAVPAQGSGLRTWLASELAAPFALGVEPTVQALLRDDRVGNRRVVLDARSVEPGPMADLCSEWVEAASREERRIGFVVLTAGAMPSLHSAVGQRWWWGQVRRLDSEVAALRFAGQRADDPVFVTAVAELAGSDLELAERLATNWNGDVEHLKYLLPTSKAGGVAHGDLGPASQAPASRHVGDWINCDVEVWEGRVRSCLGSCSDVQSEAKNRLLAAQIRALFPGIENDRQRLVARCEPWCSHLGLREDEDLESVEIGRLAHLLNHATGLPPSAGSVRRAADSLRKIRNAIAHRTLADGQLLRERQRLFKEFDE
jgi:hypothetical protein